MREGNVGAGGGENGRRHARTFMSTSSSFKFGIFGPSSYVESPLWSSECVLQIRWKDKQRQSPAKNNAQTKEKLSNLKKVLKRKRENSEKDLLEATRSFLLSVFIKKPSTVLISKPDVDWLSQTRTVSSQCHNTNRTAKQPRLRERSIFLQLAFICNSKSVNQKDDKR